MCYVQQNALTIIYTVGMEQGSHAITISH